METSNITDMITVKTAKREFQVQKTVLSKYSGYFRALFVHSTMRENQINMVDLSKSVVSGVGFGCLLRYMALDVFDVSLDQLDDVVSTIDYLQLENLQDLVYLQVWQDIDGTNFADVWNIAKKYHLKKYEVLVETFINNHLCWKFVEEHILQFGLLDLEQIRYIFEELPLKRVLSELEAFHIVSMWLDQCKDEIRRNCAYEVSMLYLKSKLSPWKYLGSAECKWK